MPERVKKHKVSVKPSNERVRDSVEVYIAFLLAFIEFPASSPSIPNRNRRIWECFSFFSFHSPVLRMASNGVILLSFPAGSHAEHSTVRKEDRIVTPKTMGWYLKPASCLPGISAAISSIAWVTPKLRAIPKMLPKRMGARLSTTASCIRQVRIFSRSTGPIEAVREELKDRVEVIPCDSPLKAVTGSNLILMASGAQTPLVTWDMLKPGTTVIGIEGFRDLDPQIGKRADKWYLGYRRPDAHILRSPRLNPGGLLKEGDVSGDMTELLTGKVPGREREDEIIVSTHMGMGAHDVNCALTVYERALEKGIGQKMVF